MIFHSRKNVYYWFVACIVVPIITNGCGYYSFSGSTLPHLKTIAIPLFEDETAEFGIKEDLTNSIIDAFTRDNTLKIADRRVSDSMLTGKLLSVRDGAGAFTSAETVQEIRVTLSVAVKFEDLKKRQVVWEERISQVGTYSPDGNAENTTREQAIAEAVENITSEVLSRTVSGW